MEMKMSRQGRGRGKSRSGRAWERVRTPAERYIICPSNIKRRELSVIKKNFRMYSKAINNSISDDKVRAVDAFCLAKFYF